MELQAPRKRQANMQTSEALGSLMFMHLDIEKRRKGVGTLKSPAVNSETPWNYFIEQF